MANQRTSILIRIFVLLVFGIPGSASAQLFETPGQLRGSGLLQSCDTSMHVWFNTTYLDGFGCAFEAEVVPGNTDVLDMTWYYYYGSDWVGTPAIPTLYALGQQPYPVCLNVNAYDMEAAQPCSTTVCQLITPLPEAVCATLVADFTIGSIDGGTIAFQDLSTFDGPIGAAFWTFGDGSSTTATTNVNTFSGAGPYEVCLTVVGEAPSQCVSTVCKWLYLGPGGVECPVLVEQGYQMLVYQNLVGVLDTSRTSGMHSRIDWQFGDGAVATGIIAVHAYASPGEYQVCGTLRVWGPLLPDTCASTICHPVQLFAMTGVEDLSSEHSSWAYPSPFAESLTVVCDGATASQFLVLDQLGRVVHTHYLPPGHGQVEVDLSALPPGFYYARLHNAGGQRTARIVKQ